MDVKIKVENITLSLEKEQVLRGVSLDIYKNMITGFMGPAGSGKSTLISAINRILYFEAHVSREGRIFIDGDHCPLILLRFVWVGVCIGDPCGALESTPRSIFEN